MGYGFEVKVYLIGQVLSGLLAGDNNGGGLMHDKAHLVERACRIGEALFEPTRKRTLQ